MTLLPHTVPLYVDAVTDVVTVAKRLHWNDEIVTPDGGRSARFRV